MTETQARLETERKQGERLVTASFRPENEPDAPGQYLSDQSKSIALFCKAKAENSTIKDVCGQPHSSMYYWMQAYVNSCELLISGLDPAENQAFTDDIYQAVALLTAQKAYYDEASYMSFGSRLRFDMRKAGCSNPDLFITLPVWAALLAQEGNWSNRSKGDLLKGNYLAVALYATDLLTCCRTLIGKKMQIGNSRAFASEILSKTNEMAPVELIEHFLKAYAVPYLVAQGSSKEVAEEEINNFFGYLTRSDFFWAPCSTKYHLSVDGGLAQHTANVLRNLLFIATPTTTEEVGACALAAIGHDLCKIGCYHKRFKNTKTYLKDGEIPPDGAQIKQDQGGQFYWAEDFYYEFKDKMPLGHGRKSANILHSFFPEIDIDVYSAVDGHMADEQTNPNYRYQFAEGGPLPLLLHIADVMATYLNENECDT